MHTKVEVSDESLRGNLRVYALLAPHIARYGVGNSGYSSEISDCKLLRAERAGVHLVMGCNTDLPAVLWALLAQVTVGKT